MQLPKDERIYKYHKNFLQLIPKNNKKCIDKRKISKSEEAVIFSNNLEEFCTLIDIAKIHTIPRK